MNTECCITANRRKQRVHMRKEGSVHAAEFRFEYSLLMRRFRIVRKQAAEPIDSALAGGDLSLRWPARPCAHSGAAHARKSPGSGAASHAMQLPEQTHLKTMTAGSPLTLQLLRNRRRGGRRWKRCCHAGCGGRRIFLSSLSVPSSAALSLQQLMTRNCSLQKQANAVDHFELPLLIAVARGSQTTQTTLRRKRR
jgi:hypothetical protein